MEATTRSGATVRVHYKNPETYVGFYRNEKEGWLPFTWNEDGSVVDKDHPRDLDLI